jgi:tRNA(adenine34) deaminase
MPGSSEACDVRMLTRCIELSRQAIKEGENPFACVICDGEEVIAEATTRAHRDADVTRHAELVALSLAQTKLRSWKLAKCTIYSNVEPCAMCSYGIRETGIGRVVYCISSPLMGGVSKWNILGDSSISEALPEVFHSPPEIVGGLMEMEAVQVWREWHPIDWAILRHRHAIGSFAHDETALAVPSRKRGLWKKLWSLGLRRGDASISVAPRSPVATSRAVQLPQNVGHALSRE